MPPSNRVIRLQYLSISATVPADLERPLVINVIIEAWLIKGSRWRTLKIEDGGGGLAEPFPRLTETVRGNDHFMNHRFSCSTNNNDNQAYLLISNCILRKFCGNY